MATVDLTLETFETTIKEPGITLVDFWAEWCGPCKMFGPIFEKVSDNHPEIRFTKVDTEANQELSGMAGISSIPTLMIFRDGILLFNQAGALPEPALTEIIGKVQALNMDDVRAELEKGQETGQEG
ncbi:thioredoxin [Candidatus Aquiluna sp. UB-MaderosW2red]|jgi:thioredoxin 1|uniref:thioredoxin n=1 Tax=Candidatus Aquiluna sp. UB-MaderosW2red TaxID=1855377 RepID=UPI000875CC4D|nr:thioredoxin [Candidatus Aquiluna sp. UB-MaderosW2red]SCX10149.1 thioredoxin 1 [Candidatus Aquiluna sp. UB-MaderosW2red]